MLQGKVVFPEYERPGVQEILNKIMKLKDFKDSLREEANRYGVEEDDVLSCMGGIYDTLFKPGHRNDCSRVITIPKKDLALNEVVCLAAIYGCQEKPGWLLPLKWRITPKEEGGDEEKMELEMEMQRERAREVRKRMEASGKEDKAEGAEDENKEEMGGSV
jgi:hypothetical protein